MLDFDEDDETNQGSDFGLLGESGHGVSLVAHHAEARSSVDSAGACGHAARSEGALDRRPKLVMDGQRGLANLEEVSRPSVEGSVGGADEPLDSGWRDTSLSESDEKDSS